MILATATELYGGGPGSGCNPDVAVPRCGRPSETSAKETGQSFRRPAPAGTYYHGTTADKAREIMRKGLSPGLAESEKSGGRGLVFLTRNFDSAKAYGPVHSLNKYGEPTKPYAVVEFNVPPNTLFLGDDPKEEAFAKARISPSLIERVQFFDKRGNATSVVKMNKGA